MDGIDLIMLMAEYIFLLLATCVCVPVGRDRLLSEIQTSSACSVTDCNMFVIVSYCHL